jgi:serine/threonine-protein kinase mTOR
VVTCVAPGFFRSIALRSENSLQDTLRLLTLWFKYGAYDDVSQAMSSGFGSVEVDTWLEVIPQVSLLCYTSAQNQPEISR